MPDAADHVPTPAPALVHLRRPDAAGAGLYRLVAAALADRTGRALWLDAGGDARTLQLDDHLPRGLDDVRVARAFTAYQHHALVRRAVRAAGPDTGVVVAPCTAALYRDDDVPDRRARTLLASSLATLRDLAGALAVPVVVTTPGDDGLHAAVAEHADRTVRCERTRAGLRYVGPDEETTVYHDGEGFQTTIPYWVDLFGCVCDASPTVTPAVPGPVEG